MTGNPPGPRRVLALIDTYRVSGPCRGLFQLMKYVKPQGHHVTAGLFLSKRQHTSPAIEEARRRGLPTAILVQAFRGDPRLIGQAVQSSRRCAAHLIQSHNYKPAFLAWRVKRVTGLPWVAFAHGYTNELPRVALYNRLDRWLLRRADRVVVMSKAMAQALLTDGVTPHRLRVIHNAIDPDDYDVDTDGNEFRCRIEVEIKDILIGVIGRLSSEKGVRHFLEAFAHVSSAIPFAKAAIVGEGPERESLESWVRAAKLVEKIRFVKYCTNISGVYAALDLLVIPSLSEGLPNVLLEALLHGKPLVVTNVGGIPEVLTGELARFCVPAGNPDALAVAIIKAITDKRWRLAVKYLGSKYVQKMFSPQERADKIQQLYNEICSDANPFGG